MPKSRRNRRWPTTILIADDEPGILRVTAMFMQACGYRVLTAENGELALRTFSEAQEPIHLVISDVVMPGMRGPQLVRAIKRLSPSTATLLMSGSWTNSSEDGSPLLCKPFTRQKLVVMVRCLLKAADFSKIEEEQSIARSQRLAAASPHAPQNDDALPNPRSTPLEAAARHAPGCTKVI